MSSATATDTGVQLRIHGSPALPTLIYLPGMHGDWTLVASFRAALVGKVRFVEMTYPRTTTWTLEDYARGVEKALQAAGVNEGWLIGESFGSQPAWQMLAHALNARSSRREEAHTSNSKPETRNSKREFHPLGLILAGGFVKHPWPWGAKFLRFLSRVIPGFVIRALLGGYAFYARSRHRQAPETGAEIEAFVANRLHPDDSAAMQRRYTLIMDEDLRRVARECKLPVFALAGLIDPIVPAPLVTRWLRQHCPGFQKAKTVLTADHNVLATAPGQSATLVLEWMKAGNSRLPEGFSFGQTV